MARPKTDEPLNPFYTLLLGISTLFVITVLAYLVATLIPGQPGMPPGGHPLGRLLDRHGPAILGVELAAIMTCSIGAMALDRWRSRRPRRGARPPAGDSINPAEPIGRSRSG